MLQFLNAFFLIFHTVLVLFNMSGWAWRKTRKLHLGMMLATAFSWLVMGLWHGMGYCICTDWHWQVRRALGIEEHDSTYIQFLVRALTGWRPDDGLVMTVTGVGFAAALLLTVFLNLRDRRLNGSITNEPSSP